jgi:hypothetical protein
LRSGARRAWWRYMVSGLLEAANAIGSAMLYWIS